MKSLSPVLTPLKSASKFTYQDYLLLSEDKRYEILEGELYMAPSPTFYHQELAKQIYDMLNAFVNKKKLGYVGFAPLDTLLSEYDVLQPDLFFISHERKAIITEKNLQGAPDLVVEVLSPETKQRDRVIKRRIYAKGGVLEYWIVDPQAKALELYVWREGDLELKQAFYPPMRFQSVLLKGFSFSLKGFFTPLV